MYVRSGALRVSRFDEFVRPASRAFHAVRSPPVIEEEFRKEQRDSTCVTESQRWQEERQAQLCLARMPAAVVPDTRPALHRRWEAHASMHST